MNVDWSQLMTKAKKDTAALAALLDASSASLSVRNGECAAQIARIQDRIDTLGYGIDSGEATLEDEDEQAALLISIKAWKNYKFSLGKVTKQDTWPAAPVWAIEPVAPVINGAPETFPLYTV